MTSIATGLSPSFVWPGSGGGSEASAGRSQFGNARTAVAGNAVVVGGYPNGFLSLNTTNASLHHSGSSWTGLLGHSLMVDHDGGVGTAPFRSRWLTQVGTFSLDSTIDGDSGTKNTSFPVPYSVTPPFIQISLDGNNALTAYVVNVSTITAGGFSSIYSGAKSGESFCNVWWESNGTVLT